MGRLEYASRVLLFLVIAALTSVSASRLAHASDTDTAISAALAVAVVLKAFVDKSTSQRDATKANEQTNVNRAAE